MWLWLSWTDYDVVRNVLGIVPGNEFKDKGWKSFPSTFTIQRCQFRFIASHYRPACFCHISRIGSIFGAAPTVMIHSECIAHSDGGFAVKNAEFYTSWKARYG